ncbi:LCP family protein [Bacillus sp. DNRA2]|uniref:LCP family protein n=1 Tax=Bacillus sp. DNRA2 TaxID=2723053 RepID=UPI00145FAEBB|nr:LCP family protein [Bacillus sp. DNRA2]NMD68705.1 LCP family protein [Bacillus sp. DNRA2]
MNNNKRKWMMVGVSLLGLVLLVIAGIVYEFNQLKPENHFTTVPVIEAESGVKTLNVSKKNIPDEKRLDEVAKEVRQSTPVFNLLLIGSDQRKGEKVGHSDSMILVHANLDQNKFNAVSIPRDTRVKLDGYGYTKLTSVQYIMQTKHGAEQGIEAAVAAVSTLMGIPINYYVETNYTGFQAMVDSVGEIEMNLPFDVKLTHPWNSENKDKVIPAGMQKLDGNMVTEVVTQRYSLKNGEYGRQQLQVEALKGIAKKALSPGQVTKLPALIKTTSEYMIATNMTTADMISLGLAVKDIDLDKQLFYQQITGTVETMYDDVLKAKNSQIVVTPQKIKEVTSTFQ